MAEPIGSIVAFAGTVSRNFEAATGWMLCDGRLLDGTDPAYMPLLDAIGFHWGGNERDITFNIPDLQGYFLRGVDPALGGRDPDADLRQSNNRGGRVGRSVGSVQGFATSLPKARFSTSESGRHVHSLDLELDASRDVDSQDNTVAYPGSPIQTASAGLHDHELSGGDRETRPVNAYANWIIRFK